MQAIQVEHDSDEWNRMWAALASEEINSGDPECAHPETQDAWQYMGTSNGVHSFRHRNHPVTGTREYRHVPMK